MSGVSRIRRVGDRVLARLARIGMDPRDDDDTRASKALLVLISVLILPVALLWAVLYLAFGSPVGWVPLVYFAILLASVVVFSRTRDFDQFLRTGQLAILFAPTLSMIPLGGFLEAGGVGLWGILAPLGALVFSDVRSAARWYVAWVVVFLGSGIAGEVVGGDACSRRAGTPPDDMSPGDDEADARRGGAPNLDDRTPLALYVDDADLGALDLANLSAPIVSPPSLTGQLVDLGEDAVGLRHGDDLEPRGLAHRSGKRRSRTQAAARHWPRPAASTTAATSRSLGERRLARDCGLRGDGETAAGDEAQAEPAGQRPATDPDAPGGQRDRCPGRQLALDLDAHLRCEQRGGHASIVAYWPAELGAVFLAALAPTGALGGGRGKGAPPVASRSTLASSGSADSTTGDRDACCASSWAVSSRTICSSRRSTRRSLASACSPIASSRVWTAIDHARVTIPIPTAVAPK